MVHDCENDQTIASVKSPATPFCPHSDDTDVPTPTLVGVYPSAESSNVPQKVPHPGARDAKTSTFDHLLLLQ